MYLLYLALFVFGGHAERVYDWIHDPLEAAVEFVDEILAVAVLDAAALKGAAVYALLGLLFALLALPRDCVGLEFALARLVVEEIAAGFLLDALDEHAIHLALSRNN